MLINTIEFSYMIEYQNIQYYITLTYERDNKDGKLTDFRIVQENNNENQIETLSYLTDSIARFKTDFFNEFIAPESLFSEEQLGSLFNNRIFLKDLFNKTLDTFSRLKYTENFRFSFDFEKIHKTDLNLLFTAEIVEGKYALSEFGKLKWVNVISPKFINEFNEAISKLNKFIEKLISQLSFTYLSPIRANQQRVYTLQSQGTSFNELLIKYLEYGFEYDKERYDFVSFWLEKLGFADSTSQKDRSGKSINNIDFKEIEGAGSQIFITKNGKKLNLTDLGYGITQILPLLMQISICETPTMMIEEPENSLHPNLQSHIADILIDAHRKFGINFIIETHSEYLIRKFLYLAADKIEAGKDEFDISNEDVVMYYFNDPENLSENQEQIIKLKVDTDGSLDNEFGEGFIDEADTLAIDLFNLKKQ